jgi:hypothetical protein
MNKEVQSGIHAASNNIRANIRLDWRAQNKISYAGDVIPLQKVQELWHILEVKIVRVGSGDGVGQDPTYRGYR